MTVKELRNALEKFPQDITVTVYGPCALDEASGVCVIKYPESIYEDGSPETVVVIT